MGSRQLLQYTHLHTLTQSYTGVSLNKKKEINFPHTFPDLSRSVLGTILTPRSSNLIALLRLSFYKCRAGFFFFKLLFLSILNSACSSRPPFSSSGSPSLLPPPQPHSPPELGTSAWDEAPGRTLSTRKLTAAHDDERAPEKGSLHIPALQEAVWLPVPTLGFPT